MFCIVLNKSYFICIPKKGTFRKKEENINSNEVRFTWIIGQFNKDLIEIISFFWMVNQ